MGALHGHLNMPGGSDKKDDRISLEDLAWLLLRLNKKVNLLVEALGVGNKLGELADELHESTARLEAAVEANQPKKKLEEN